jgi:hypothetical protein
MRILSGERFEWMMRAEVCRKDSPLQIWSMPFWIYRHAQACVKILIVLELASTSSRSTRDERYAPGIDAWREDMTGSVANTSSFLVSSRGSTIS